jgi:hypothetical protein
MGGQGLAYRGRPLTAADLERRERVAQIRSASRKGSSPKAIADVSGIPLAMVEQVLKSVGDPRLSDPADLLTTRRAAPGHTSADVQIYWVGFLTAAGRIWGQGAALTLVITLGDMKPPTYIKTIMADLADPHARSEFCQSSLQGWQLYIRDPSLCKALIPWGIPSDLHGEDPALLDDLPEEFAAPFLRGYVDGNWPIRQSVEPKKHTTLILQGSQAILVGINAMVHRHWGVDGGVVNGRRPPRAELRFPNTRDEQEILRRTAAYTSRMRLADDHLAGQV